MLIINSRLTVQPSDLAMARALGEIERRLRLWYSYMDPQAWGEPRPAPMVRNGLCSVPVPELNRIQVRPL